MRFFEQGNLPRWTIGGIVFCLLWSLYVASGSQLIGAAWAQEAAQPQPAAAGDDLDTRLNREFSDEMRKLLVTHCGDCHMGDANEAGVNFEDYTSIDKIREHASTWEQVRGVVRADAMPPPEDSKMTPEERKKLVDWIQRALHETDCNCEIKTPPVTLRRLNQVEYDNTVRDLLQLDVLPSKDIGFVSDDVGNGFDNQGEVLTLPPIVMEKYMQSAAYLAKKAIETDREKLRNQRFDGIALTYGQDHRVPMHLAAGRYNLSIRMRFGDNLPDECFVLLYINGEKHREWEVTTKGQNFDVDFDAKEGPNEVLIAYESDEDPSKKGDGARRLLVDSFRTRGPFQGEPAFPKRHQDIVIAYPEQKDTPEGDEIGFTEATRRVFAGFLKRAYRRPPSDEDVESIVRVCEAAKEAGFTYLESIQYGVQAALVSPSFLFRHEPPVDGVPTIDDYALATRLSYFLWSTMPDAELMALADSGKLREPEVLKGQVKRMLESDRSEALVKGFFAQWLGMRNLPKIDIDKTKYPGWNDRLRASMMKETELFCQYLLKEGTIDDITSADFTFVNPRLAEFYGVSYGDEDPAKLFRGRGGRGGDSRRQGLYEKEDEWIRVKLPEQRLGLLTQAAVLSLTSNPARTSPVKRGKWILESILGDPPPSAPPNVPTLEEGKHEEGATLRDRLEIHRSNPSCAGCHKILDPIGLGLENFDAIGRWREKEDNQPIDAKGELTDGSTFETPRQLVSILSRKQDQILLNLAQRMMTYSLGRGLQREDRCASDRVVAYTEANNRTVRSLVEAIVLSGSFQQTPTLNPSPSLGASSDVQ